MNNWPKVMMPYNFSNFWCLRCFLGWYFGISIICRALTWYCISYLRELDTIILGTRFKLWAIATEYVGNVFLLHLYILPNQFQNTASYYQKYALLPIGDFLSCWPFPVSNGLFWDWSKVLVYHIAQLSLSVSFIWFESNTHWSYASATIYNFSTEVPN